MSAQDRLGLDLIGLVIVVAAANPAISGVVLHEWIGTLLIGPLVIHLVLNWGWVAKTTGAFLGKLRATSRFNLVVDALLFVSVIAVSLSGALVIPGFAASLGLQASPVWHAVHLATSDSTIALLGIHFALHSRWMLNTARRMLAPTPPVAREIVSPWASPVPQRVAANSSSQTHPPRAQV